MTSKPDTPPCAQPSETADDPFDDFVFEGITETLPLIPLENAVLFPFTLTSFTVADSDSISLLDDAIEGDRLVAFFPQKPTTPGPSVKPELYEVGTAGRIVKTLRLPDGSKRILVRGIRRIRMERITRRKPYLRAKTVEIGGGADESMEVQALVRNITSLVENVLGLSPHLPEEMRVALYNIDDYGRLADFVADAFNLRFEDKLAVLHAIPVRERLEVVFHFLNREAMIMQLGSEIQEQVSMVFNKSQRESFLREQLRVIQQQLEEPEDTPETAAIRETIESADLPDTVQDAAERELERLRQMHPAAAEFTVARTYIDWLTALPWKTTSQDILDLERARKILDEDHYDLKRVKERILDFMAVLNLKKDVGRAPILCFVGPPGVGKTSLGKSIARTLGREFVRMSLGGVRDEAEIRGHRRTYVGAMPGRIIQGLRKAGTRNPVFMLDEIDKLTQDFRGDPASALLEVLDPQQNTEFSDHYLELDFDLSQILFITTANLTDPILPALRDRMEVIRIPGYTHEEKLQIAKRFLVPRQVDENGLKRSKISFHKAALDVIINSYTNESGVRNLERMIGNVCRKHARRLVGGDTDEQTVFKVTKDIVRDGLGPRRLFPETVLKTPALGVVCGLAWTSAGGEIIQIEATRFPGKGNLVLTGSLGDVMKESARIALTLVGAMHEELGFEPDLLKSEDIHIHVPSGATPKDGPSAGVAIATALASLFSGLPVRERIAMTGEISLQGRILPVGGLKEKVLAAVRGGVKDLYLPLEAQAEIEEEVPAELLKKLNVHYVSAVQQVIIPALGTRS
jgi:ATP-dependent Lon protease